MSEHGAVHRQQMKDRLEETPRSIHPTMGFLFFVLIFLTIMLTIYERALRAHTAPKREFVQTCIGTSEACRNIEKAINDELTNSRGGHNEQNERRTGSRDSR